MSRPGLAEAQVSAALAEVILEVTGIVTDLDSTFFAAGITSAQLVEVHSRLQPRLGCAMPVTDLFQHPTRRALAGHLAGSPSQPAPTAPALPPPQPAANRITPPERRELRAWLRSAGER